ncbi:PAS domain-containing sensor histidine kinase [Spirosoma aerophilum]
MKNENKSVLPEYGAELERLVFTLQDAGIGTWSYHLSKKAFYLDEQCQTLFDLPTDGPVAIDQLLDCLYADDREVFGSAVQQALINPEAGQFSGKFSTRSMPNRWLDNRGTAYFDAEGILQRFSGVVQDITHLVGQRQKQLEGTISHRENAEPFYAQSDRLKLLFDQAPVVLSIMGRQPDFVYQMANPAYAEFIGRPLDEIIGKPLLEVLPEIKGQGFDTVLEQVMTSGIPYIAREAPVTLNRRGKTELLYLDFIYQPIYYAEEEAMGVMGLVIDVTNSVASRKKVEQSETRFRQVIEQTPVAMLLVKGPDFVFDTVNQSMLSLLSRGTEIIGKSALEALPELASQPIMDILKRVYETGESYNGWAVEIPLVRNGVLETAYFNLNYTPYFEGSQLTGIIQVANEVTEQIKARKIVEASEARFRTLLQAAPVAIGLFVGRDLVIESPNQAFIDLVGKGDTIVGKTLREAMPELEDQPFLQILDDVFTAGKSFQTFDAQVNVMHNGVLTSGYYDFSYTPVLNAENEVYAILEIAQDVTERVVNRQKVAEAEESFRGAIELAELGTWSIDPATGAVFYSERLRNWFGYEDSEVIDMAFEPVHKKDRLRVKKAIAYALKPESGGIYEAEFTVVNNRTGIERILHAQAKTYFTDERKAYKMMGTARDVTEQRKAQVRLEQEVQQRTQALMLANQDLIRSNDNLQQFAYVASHDLQEPLRKIQSYGDILKEQFASQPGEETYYLERMQSAASRMSGLIKDLLAFSRISIQQDATEAVSLMDVVNSVLIDLELAIHETGAAVTVGALPTIQGDSSQLGQLFQNLISNALKFRQPATAPVITITSKRILAANLPRSIKPVRMVGAYHCIDVVDNGIGFDEKYVDRIFQVFQRLHAKNEFTGTGIGLAICEKVVANHGGCITAQSKPGKGATFTVYLPVDGF